MNEDTKKFLEKRAAQLEQQAVAYECQITEAEDTLAQLHNSAKASRETAADIRKIIADTKSDADINAIRKAVETIASQFDAVTAGGNVMLIKD